MNNTTNKDYIKKQTTSKSTSKIRKPAKEDNTSFKNLIHVKKSQLKNFFDNSKIITNEKSGSKKKVTVKTDSGDIENNLKKPKHYTAKLKKDLIYEKDFLNKENNDLTDQINKKNEELNEIKMTYLQINVTISYIKIIIGSK
jgi:hypothetical protein